MVVFPFRAQICLYQTLVMIICYEIINAWGTVSAFIHSLEFSVHGLSLFEQRIERFTTDLVYIRFT